MNRHVALEEAVNTQYGIISEVYQNIINSNDYEIIIKANGKEILLREHMKNGLTKHVVLTTDKSTMYKKYHEAEEDGIEYLKG